MDQEELRKQKKKIEEIYQEYLQKIGELRKEQDKIIDEFTAELEKAKMEEVRNKIEK